MRWIWFLVAALVSTSVYFTIRYGLRPKPIPVMNPTEFADLEQVGVVIYKRLKHDLRSERLVLLGSSPDIPDEHKIWSGLLKAAVADKEKIVLFSQTGMPPLNDAPAWETVTFDEKEIASGAFNEKVKERLQAGHLAVVYSLTPEVSHLVHGSLSHRLEKVVQHPVLSISSLRLALKQADIDSLETRCLTDTGDTHLACAARKVARKYVRKNLDPAKTWAVMEKHGLKEYLVYLSLP